LSDTQRTASHPRRAYSRLRHSPVSFEHYRTYAEYLRHPSFKAVRELVMQRARGICQECRVSPATEVHHVDYPPWGTFDVPWNLVPICHGCHCIVHGKDD